MAGYLQRLVARATGELPARQAPRPVFAPRTRQADDFEEVVRPSFAVPAVSNAAPARSAHSAAPAPSVSSAPSVPASAPAPSATIPIRAPSVLTPREPIPAVRPDARREESERALRVAEKDAAHDEPPRTRKSRPSELPVPPIEVADESFRVAPRAGRAPETPTPSPSAGRGPPSAERQSHQSSPVRASASFLPASATPAMSAPARPPAQLHIGRILVEVAPQARPTVPVARPSAPAAPRGALTGSSLLGQRFGLGQL